MATKTLEAIRSMNPLEEREEYIGAFYGQTKIHIWWAFIIGPFSVFTMKKYQVVVTNRRILFGKLSLSGKIANIDKFTFHEIESVSFNKGFLLNKISFKFKNSITLNLGLPKNSVGKAEEGFLLDEKLQTYLSKAIKCDQSKQTEITPVKNQVV